MFVVGLLMSVLEYKNYMRGELRYNEPMGRHTSWRVGGLAKYFYEPADIDDIADFMSHLSDDEPVLWIGLGSNLLVRDGGFQGTVIKTSGLLDNIHQVQEARIRVEAGVSCAKVARFAVSRGLGGAEFLAGIPGTMGGALAMNAGAFGNEIWSIVDHVEILDRHGETYIKIPSDFQIGYRSVDKSDDEWFIAGTLNLSEQDKVNGRKRIREFLNQRNKSQPTNKSSCGSVFRNPPNYIAARLIETSGLKGMSVGGASVSHKHANFIINNGSATASDIEKLIEKISTVVFQEHGIQLIPEVHILGGVK